MMMFLFSAESDPGKRKRPQVPNDHEEPCQEIRHPGAEDDKEDGVDNFVDSGALSNFHIFTFTLSLSSRIDNFVDSGAAEGGE